MLDGGLLELLLDDELDELLDDELVDDDEDELPDEVVVVGAAHVATRAMISFGMSFMSASRSLLRPTYSSYV